MGWVEYQLKPTQPMPTLSVRPKLMHQWVCTTPSCDKDKGKGSVWREACVKKIVSHWTAFILHWLWLGP